MPLNTEEEWKYWDEKAVDLPHEETEAVNASAAKWQALATALLGVFGLVAFAGGLTTLDKLGEPWRTSALVMTSIAVVTAVIGLILLGIASGGLWTVLVKHPVDGLELKRLAHEHALRANKCLKYGQWFTAVTVALVLSGSMMILWAGPSENTQKYVAIFADRGPAYGELVEGPKGKLILNGQELGKDLVSLTPVSAKPSPQTQ